MIKITLLIAGSYNEARGIPQCSDQRRIPITHPGNFRQGSRAETRRARSRTRASSAPPPGSHTRPESESLSDLIPRCGFAADRYRSVRFSDGHNSRAAATLLDTIPARRSSCPFFLLSFFFFPFFASSSGASAGRNGIAAPPRFEFSNPYNSPYHLIPPCSLSSRLHRRHDVARNKRRAICSRIPFPPYLHPLSPFAIRRPFDETYRGPPLRTLSSNTVWLTYWPLQTLLYFSVAVLASDEIFSLYRRSMHYKTGRAPVSVTLASSFSTRFQ